MGRIKDTFGIIFDDPGLGRIESEQYDTLVLCWGGIFLALISAVLTIFNVVLGYTFMSWSTASLTIGFALAADLAYAKKFQASRIVMAVICAVNFSIYAIIGGNEGFAILWTLLIPVLGMLLIGLRMGFLLSLYFQLFVIVLFYTPLSSVVAGDYTQTFMMRFPVLYFTTFVAVTFLMCQRQKLYRKTSEQATRDALTGLMNRYSLKEFMKELEVESVEEELVLSTLDINRLKWVNDSFGHLAGDELIIEAARAIEASFPGDPCFRIGGDEFVVISRCSSVEENVLALRKRAAEWKGELSNFMSFSVGTASRADYPNATCRELARVADRLMYQDKGDFYSQNGVDRRSR